MSKLLRGIVLGAMLTVLSAATAVVAAQPPDSHEAAIQLILEAIDKAIRDSNLGLNPQVDGDFIRIPIEVRHRVWPRRARPVPSR